MSKKRVSVSRVYTSRRLLSRKDRCWLAAAILLLLVVLALTVWDTLRTQDWLLFGLITVLVGLLSAWVVRLWRASE